MELKKENKQLQRDNTQLKLRNETKRCPSKLPNPLALGEDKLLSLGLSLVGFDETRQKCCNNTSLRRWRSHYGIGTQAIKSLIVDMVNRQAKMPFDLKHLFMSLGWLKMYENEEQMAGRWKYGEQFCR